MGPVSVQNGQIFLEGQPLQAESVTRFFNEGGATYTFVIDPAGRAQGLRFEVPGLTLVASKVAK